MTEPHVPANPSALSPSASQATVAGSVRPRNRHRLAGSGSGSGSGSGHGSGSGLGSGAHDGASSPRLSPYSASSSRTASPRPPGRSALRPSPTTSGPGTLGQFLGDSWNQGWSSVQGFASTLLTLGNDGLRPDVAASPRPWSPSRASSSRRECPGRSSTRKNSGSWGPAPPTQTLGVHQVAAGSIAEREAALKAARTASVLESHDGVNGGLDVTGMYKRRNSDDTSPPENRLPEDCLVYIHRVQPDDTYAGLILRYKCREDDFRRANGLWSRDSIQTRKWLAIPVDACEIRGRPCEAPPWQHASREVDLLPPTPTAADTPPSPSGRKPVDGHLSSRLANGRAAENSTQWREEDMPWTHVRWVQIDSTSQPIQIGRVTRQALGYFPPRRKKSIRTASSLSTPRQSSDFSIAARGSLEHASPRRQSLLDSRRPQGPATPALSRSRVGSDTADGRPAWMRRPGGVGSMSSSVRAPGPDSDFLNSWTRRHLPGLNIEGLPSMSVMGSETARFGFAPETSEIVESPFEDGRDTTAASWHGSGLDRAAAAVESWLRGALAKRPSTPLRGTRSRPAGPSMALDDSDLIELADTGSEDGRLLVRDTPAPRLSSLSLDRGDVAVRERPQTMAAAGTRGRRKAD